MKLVIASDLHGSAFWTEKLMAEVERIAPDQVVLLGDLLYHGPRNDLPDGYDPKRVIPLLNGMADRIVAVRGNCEAEVDQMVLDFPCMADYALVMDGARQLFCTHGHLWNPDHLPPLVTGAVASSATSEAAIAEPAFLYGHTHVKQNEVRGGIRLFNPGSVSIPKDGTHSFGLYDNGEFSTCELA